MQHTCDSALQGLEVYSTVLWHLRREVELAHLAQRAVALDRLSPAAWCAVGNCFSLHKVRQAARRQIEASPPRPMWSGSVLHPYSGTAAVHAHPSALAVLPHRHMVRATW